MGSVINLSTLGRNRKTRAAYQRENGGDKTQKHLTNPLSELLSALQNAKLST